MRAHLMICFQLKVLSSFPQTDSNSSFRLRIPSQLPKYCFSDTMWLLRILLQQVFQSNSQTGSEAKQGTSLKTCKRCARDEAQTLMINVSFSHYSQHSTSGPPTRKYDGSKTDKKVAKSPQPQAAAALFCKAVCCCQCQMHCANMHMLKVWAWPEVFEFKFKAKKVPHPHKNPKGSKGIPTFRGVAVFC